MEKNFFDTLTWHGNSREMMRAVLNEIPAFFRGPIKRQIKEWVIKNKISTVTEDLVFKAVDDIAPRDMAEKRIKPGLEKMRTK